MVIVGEGRFELPDDLHYTQNQHVYINSKEKCIGIDEIGVAFLKPPVEIKFLVSDKVIVGEPFASIVTESGITTLDSPCSGEIESLNESALSWVKTDTYTKGYLIKLKEITELHPSLISGEALNDWGENEVKSFMRYNYSFKIIEIGDSAVGKTAIKVRFTDNFFKKNLKTTLGVDFGSKVIKEEYLSGDILFSGTYRFTATMNVWDAAGQAHFDKIRGMYYQDAKGALLVYDMNNPLSFDHLDKWVTELEENVGKKIPVLLVGNKSDLEHKVERHKGLDYAMKKGYLFIECSAKTGENVEKAFKQLAIEIFKQEENL